MPTSDGEVWAKEGEKGGAVMAHPFYFHFESGETELLFSYSRGEGKRGMEQGEKVDRETVKVVL